MMTWWVLMREWTRLIKWPTALFLLGFYGLYIQHGDWIVARLFYEWEGHRWALNQNWLIGGWLHNGARKLNSALMFSVVIFYVYRKFFKPLAAQRMRALSVLLVSVLLSVLIVSLCKHLLLSQCPWDLQQFGGHWPFVSLFETKPYDMTLSQCFPAGHASIGYAWIALYFYWLPVSPRKAKVGLGIGLLAGFTLGLAQQFRGAHFLSHDLTTAWLCWLIACSVYIFWPHPKNQASDV